MALPNGRQVSRFGFFYSYDLKARRYDHEFVPSFYQRNHALQLHNIDFRSFLALSQQRTEISPWDSAVRRPFDLRRGQESGLGHPIFVVKCGTLASCLHPDLPLDGGQRRGRGGLIAVYVPCFNAETLSLSASSDFYFVCA